MPEGKYNGFTNYETWLVHLWMGAEEGSQAFFNETAKTIYSETDDDNTRLTVAESARFRFADWLKDYYTDECRPDLPGVYGDLLGAALDAVLEEV